MWGTELREAAVVGCHGLCVAGGCKEVLWCGTLMSSWEGTDRDPESPDPSAQDAWVTAATSWVQGREWGTQSRGSAVSPCPCNPPCITSHPAQQGSARCLFWCVDKAIAFAHKGCYKGDVSALLKEFPVMLSRHVV